MSAHRVNVQGIQKIDENSILIVIESAFDDDEKNENLAMSEVTGLENSKRFFTQRSNLLLIIQFEGIIDIVDFCIRVSVCLWLFCVCVCVWC